MTTAASAMAAAPASPYRRGEALAVLALMIAASTAVVLVHLSLNVLVDPVRRSFGIDDVRFSVLLGVGHAAPFVVMSICGGWLVDRLPRRPLLMAAIVVWTAGALVSAFADGYTGLLAGRILIGLGAGIKLPLAMTWIHDAFPAGQRGRGIGAFFVVLGIGPSLAVTLAGATFGLAGRGVFVGWPLVGALEPWRATLLLMALPSVVVLPFVLALRDRRASSPLAADAAAGSATPAHRLHWPPLLLLAGGVALLAMLDGANLSWMPTVYMRGFGYDAQAAGLVFGVVTMIAGIAGPLAGGWAGDLAYRRAGLAGRLWLCAAAAAISAPLLLLYLGDSPLVLAVALTVGGIFTVTGLSLGYVTVQAILPGDRRGVGTGMLNALTTLVGSAGPTLVAWSSQRWFGGPSGLAAAVAWVCFGIALLAALCLAAAARASARRPRAGG